MRVCLSLNMVPLLPWVTWASPYPLSLSCLIYKLGWLQYLLQRGLFQLHHPVNIQRYNPTRLRVCLFCCRIPSSAAHRVSQAVFHSAMWHWSWPLFCKLLHHLALGPVWEQRDAETEQRSRCRESNLCTSEENSKTLLSQLQPPLFVREFPLMVIKL